MKHLFRLRVFIKPYLRQIAANFFALFAVTGLSLVVPRILQRVIDDGLLHGQVGYLAQRGASPARAGGCYCPAQSCPALSLRVDCGPHRVRPPQRHVRPHPVPAVHLSRSHSVGPIDYPLYRGCPLRPGLLRQQHHRNRPTVVPGGRRHRYDGLHRMPNLRPLRFCRLSPWPS